MSPYKNPDTQKHYMRDDRRRKRADSNSVKSNETANDAPSVNLEFSIKTSEDLRLLLEVVVNQVMNTDSDPLMKGRVVALLINAGVRIMEITDISQRIDKLEERVFNVDKKEVAAT